MKKPALLIVILGIGSGCYPETMVPPDTVAELGGEDILYAEFDRYLKTSVGEESSGLDSEVLSRLLDRFLDERALLLLARERGFDGEPRLGQALISFADLGCRRCP